MLVAGVETDTHWYNKSFLNLKGFGNSIVNINTNVFYLVG
jgi:hypothetical protein